MIKAILFDRDGTLIEDRHYLSDPAGVTLLPGVGQALGFLASRGVRLFMVSNQSGIGRGYFTRQDADACNARLQELLVPYHAQLEGMEYCPHAPEEACTCRKPGTGMWKALKQKYFLDASTTLMVGDKPEDLQFASNAGLLGSILVLTGKGQKTAEILGLLNTQPCAKACAADGAKAGVGLSADSGTGIQYSNAAVSNNAFFGAEPSNPDASGVPGCDAKKPNAPGCDAETSNVPGCDAETFNVPGCDAETFNVPGCDAEKPNAPGCDTETSNVPGCDAGKLNAPGCDAETPSNALLFPQGQKPGYPLAVIKDFRWFEQVFARLCGSAQRAGA